MIETDASRVGLKAVLAQEVEDGTLHPVAYASRTLQPHEQNYGATELGSWGGLGYKVFQTLFVWTQVCDIY